MFQTVLYSMETQNLYYGRKSMKHLFSTIPMLILLLGMILSACTGSGAISRLEGTEWQLIKMNGKELPPHILVTLGFNDDQAGGKAPCNSYSASYLQNGSELSFDPISSTMMYCEDSMDYETEYGSTLSTVKSFKLEEDQLSLMDGSGTEVLVFRKP